MPPRASREAEEYKARMRELSRNREFRAQFRDLSRQPVEVTEQQLAERLFRAVIRTVGATGAMASRDR